MATKIASRFRPDRFLKGAASCEDFKALQRRMTPTKKRGDMFERLVQLYLQWPIGARD